LTPSYRQVVRYDLRYAIEANGILDDEWQIEIITSSQFPYTVSNLKRGAVYAFQVRALGKLGFTDWSDSFTFMCT
jgi:ABC-type nitrate/sulfonate/bicarbonate transport system substrate-binding protein